MEKPEKDYIQLGLLMNGELRANIKLSSDDFKFDANGSISNKEKIKFPKVDGNVEAIVLKFNVDGLPRYISNEDTMVIFPGKFKIKLNVN